MLVRDNAPELRLMHDWLDNWSGIGLIIAGMTYQGWDVQLTAYAARDWRATFYVTGLAHSILGGSAWGANGMARRAAGRLGCMKHAERHL